MAAPGCGSRVTGSATRRGVKSWAVTSRAPGSAASAGSRVLGVSTPMRSVPAATGAGLALAVAVGDGGAEADAVGGTLAPPGVGAPGEAGRAWRRGVGGG